MEMAYLIRTQSPGERGIYTISFNDKRNGKYIISATMQQIPVKPSHLSLY
jgi:hypothetical protein